MRKDREWLVTNALGGYASGNVAGPLTRRYHGLLVAALPAPAGRVVLLDEFAESLRIGAEEAMALSGGEEESGPSGPVAEMEFRLETGLPVWRFSVRGWVLEKRVLLLHRQNTVQVSYRIIEKGTTAWPRLELRPRISFRPQSTAVDEITAGPYRIAVQDGLYEFSAPAKPALPPLRIKAEAGGVDFRLEERTIGHVFYPSEKERGYPDHGTLWSPGVFGLRFSPEQPVVTVLASTASRQVIDLLSAEAASQAERIRRERLFVAAHPALREDFGAELVLAADQFVAAPAGRAEETARARAQGDELRTVMAGYHWFADWGRDTMISLEGLTLLTGRADDARYILHTFAHYIRNGLIPNMIPDGAKQSGGQYNTADATLWFFHALDRYLEHTHDPMTLRILLPKLLGIMEHHFAGTDFKIHVDKEDGLLVQGEEGVQLTWMDAKAGDWVVTPRRGKAVEINALWFNALSLLTGWLRTTGDDERAELYAAHARRAEKSFNARFWNARCGCLFDVIDGPNGDDEAVRPNQVLAISLPHPVLAAERWAPVLEVIEAKLLTPVGLRSLSPDDPDYQPTYDGDRKSRDGAYHQGTVWLWLIGPFIDAWLRVHPGEKAEARRFLARFPDELSKFGMGTLAEICDAEEPHRPRGCIAQAWSVAEVLRAWVKTAAEGERGSLSATQKANRGEDTL